MVLEKIKEALSDMPPTNQKIGIYIIEHGESAGFSSIREMSKVIDVSSASLVRFAQSLGFKGYKEFKEALQNDIKVKIGKGPKIPLHELDVLSVKKQVDKLFQNEISNLKKTLDSIDPDALLQMVEGIKTSKRIFVSGFGVSRNIIQILEYALVSMQHKEVLNITGSLSDYNPRLHNFTSDDCLFILTFPPYSREGLQVVDFVKERGGKIFLFTDSPQCPLYFKANTVIRCENNSLLLTNSYVGIVAVIQILINMLLLNSKDSLLNHMGEVQREEEQGYLHMGEQKDIQ